MAEWDNVKIGKRHYRRFKVHPRSMKPFISRVVKNGVVQKAFREKIGQPTGACVKHEIENLRKEGKPLTADTMYKIAAWCAGSYEGTKIL